MSDKRDILSVDITEHALNPSPFSIYLVSSSQCPRQAMNFIPPNSYLDEQVLTSARLSLTLFLLFWCCLMCLFSAILVISFMYTI